MTTPSSFQDFSNSHFGIPMLPETPPRPRARRLHTWLLLGGLVAIIVVAAGGYFAYSNFVTISVGWGTSPTGFSSQDQQQLSSAIQASLAGVAPGHRFTIIGAQREQNWAILSLNEREPSAQAPIATEPLFYVANQSGTNWTVSSPASADFCTELQSLPASLLDDGDKHYFLGCYPSPGTTLVTGAPLAESASLIPARQLTMSTVSAPTLSAKKSSSAGSFHLPVLPGATVYVSQGNNDLLRDHNGAQRYAFDFTVGQQNFTITAAQGGQVIGENDKSNIQCDGDPNYETSPQSKPLNMCWTRANFLLIADDDGTTASLYMHLLPGSLLVHDGDTVAQGQPLAKAGTTGWSTGVHLHLQIESIPTPQSDPYTGWWWRPTLPLTFDDPAVLAQDSNGIPLEGKSYTEGKSSSTGPTPTPSLAQESVYVVDGNGAIHSYRASDGQEQWVTHGGPNFASVDEVANGLLFATSSGGQAMAAIRASDGTILWQQNEQLVDISGQRIFTTSVDASSQYLPPGTTVFALDAQTGREIWHFTAPSDIQSIALSATAVYVTYYTNADATSSELDALSVQNGQLLWRSQSQSATLSGELELGNGNVYWPVWENVQSSGASNVTIQALNAATGTPAWSFQFSTDVSDISGPFMQMYSSNGRLYVEHQGNTSADNTVATLDERSGKTLWDTTCFLGGANPITDSHVYVSCGQDENEADALDARTGQVQWHRQFGQNTSIGIDADAGNVVYINATGPNGDSPAEYALDVSSGNTLWNLPGWLEGANSSLALILTPDGGVLAVNPLTKEVKWAKPDLGLNQYGQGPNPGGVLIAP